MPENVVIGLAIPSLLKQKLEYRVTSLEKILPQRLVDFEKPNDMMVPLHIIKDVSEVNLKKYCENIRKESEYLQPAVMSTEGVGWNHVLRGQKPVPAWLFHRIIDETDGNLELIQEKIIYLTDQIRPTPSLLPSIPMASIIGSNESEINIITNHLGSLTYPDLGKHLFRELVVCRKIINRIGDGVYRHRNYCVDRVILKEQK